MSGANQRSMTSVNTDVTPMSARITPCTPSCRAITRTIRITIVASERLKPRAMNVRVRPSMRMTWKGR